MEKTGKIVLGVALPLAVFGIYWFGVRNRKPFFMLSKYDFVNNKVNVDFGYNKKTVALGDSGEMTAGKTYNPNKYKLVFTSKDKTLEFVIKNKDGEEVSKQIIDFGAKIVY
jgi:hypothetical protein